MNGPRSIALPLPIPASGPIDTLLPAF